MFEKSNLEELFRTHYRVLCLYSTHFVGDIDTAEDIVMDSFLKYSEKLKQGEKIVSPKSYIYQMVRNASYDYNKHTANFVSPEMADDIADNAEDWVERSRREARLWTEIDKLPAACRNVLLMNKRDGMKHVEIADALGISIKTVEAHMRKAYTTLREKAKSIYMMVFI